MIRTVILIINKGVFHIDQKLGVHQEMIYAPTDILFTTADHKIPVRVFHIGGMKMRNVSTRPTFNSVLNPSISCWV